MIVYTQRTFGLNTNKIGLNSLDSFFRFLLLRFIFFSFCFHVGVVVVIAVVPRLAAYARFAVIKKTNCNTQIQCRMAGFENSDFGWY